MDFLSKIREEFDEFDEQAKATLPNINYRAVTRRQRKKKGMERAEMNLTLLVNSFQRIGLG